ncbi:nitronate monooxygenase [bacterium]|nr:MAG: nitronate monooxygenase [bacterium]
MTEPKIIQGGMGIAVSNWRLARAVSVCGELGVVSGTAMDAVLTRRLQLGDEGGHMRRALGAFPDQAMACRVLDRYFAETHSQGKAHKSRPMPAQKPSRFLQELTVVANFAEVYLAKEGHNGLVGFNLLEKIQLPTLLSLFGAMLAGVDYVLMGAGIPRAIPMALDRLSAREPMSLALDVKGAQPGDDFSTHLDPRELLPDYDVELKRPKFLPIVSSATLATTLARKGTGRVDGFVVEGKSAGGHNAPPRGALQLDERGEPVYGPRDEADIDAIGALGLPFWLAGSYGKPERFEEALALGATGIQVGTAFAFCEESGIREDLKRQVLRELQEGKVEVFTDPFASPTGFPFKVVQAEGTLSDAAVFEDRERICDLGYLRQSYRREDGTLGYRCPAEPEDDFVRKQGALEETVGRKCVCNGLFATVGLGQTRKGGYEEPPLLTAGDDVASLGRYLQAGRESYTAAEVVETLRRSANPQVALA